MCKCGNSIIIIGYYNTLTSTSAAAFVAEEFKRIQGEEDHSAAEYDKDDPEQVHKHKLKGLESKVKREKADRDLQVRMEAEKSEKLLRLEMLKM